MTNSIDIALYGFLLKDNEEISSSLLSTYGYLSFSLFDSPYIANYTERTLNLFIEQFQKDKPKLHGFVSAFTEEMQEIENAFRGLQILRGLNTAKGKQLDKIGKIVGQSRTSGDDVIYRNDIIFKIFLNSSSGQPETIIQAILKFTKAETVDFKESNPATITLTINKSSSPIPSNLQRKINKLIPAGVQIFLQLNNSETPFIFSGEGVYPPYFFGEGFGETGTGNENIGGNFTELLSN